MLQKIFKNNDDQITGIIQVGANIGQEIPLITQYSDNIYLFEPLSKIFNILKKNSSGYKNINIFNFALGQKEEIKKIYIADLNNSASSSILKPSSHLEYYPEIKFNRTEEIAVKRFDSLDSEFDANFLILDVQGYELEVIKGFGNKINDIDFIYTEVSTEELYENNILIKELDGELYNLGYLRTNTKFASNKPQGDALYKKLNSLSSNHKRYYLVKSRLQITKTYLFLNFIKDFRKIFFLIKKHSKKFINS